MKCNIEQFTYEKVSKKLVSEASTIGLTVGAFPKQITVVGKTAKVLFELHYTHSTPDAIIYVPHSSWKGTPIGELILVIYNT